MSRSDDSLTATASFDTAARRNGSRRLIRSLNMAVGSGVEPVVTVKSQPILGYRLPRRRIPGRAGNRRSREMVWPVLPGDERFENRIASSCTAAKHRSLVGGTGIEPVAPPV